MLIKAPFLSVPSRNGHCSVEIGHPRAVTHETDRYQWECGSERERERERGERGEGGREREREGGRERERETDTDTDDLFI